MIRANSLKTCPNVDSIELKIFGPLTLETKGPIEPKDQNLEFSFPQGADNGGTLSLVYINQQNVPVVQPIKELTAKGGDGKTRFTSPLTYTKNLMNGLTIAAVVEGEGPFPNITSVGAKTLFGPALIEIN